MWWISGPKVTIARDSRVDRVPKSTCETIRRLPVLVTDLTCLTRGPGNTAQTPKRPQDPVFVMSPQEHHT